MGYLPTGLSTPGTRVFAEVRDKRLAVDVTGLPFVVTKYARPRREHSGGQLAEIH
jgi:aminomethyltransferase